MATNWKRAQLASLLLAATAVAGCGDPVVDSWPIGGLTADCGPSPCADLIEVAKQGLDHRDPAHAPFKNVELHTVGVAQNGVVHNRSGGPLLVARFELTDGTVRAIGVGYAGVSTTPQAFEFDP